MIKLKDILNEESVNEDFWALPAEWSSQEARLHLDKDIKDMSKIFHTKCEPQLFLSVSRVELIGAPCASERQMELE